MYFPRVKHLPFSRVEKCLVKDWDQVEIESRSFGRARVNFAQPTIKGRFSKVERTSCTAEFSYCARSSAKTGV